MQLSTSIPEESPPYNFVFIQQIQKRVCILAEAGSEDHNLKACSHLCHKAVHVGPLENIHLNSLVLNLNRYDKVRVRDRLEGGVYQCLIQVEHQALFVLVTRCCWPYYWLS